ncbi:sugar ABC transporter substrate-binding protein [Lacticaseibacillus jixianensis]|uniref:Sugar ABC transporter substrate-binding protein n=1 Tax=Lacticaseibacillus jixianensis TaxID=2486012 RepID=A0ABW4BET1_9LACO|nr:sugar ABC transporter substrate-binding protein [Lacticaseibacillus jixianensis]
MKISQRVLASGVALAALAGVMSGCSSNAKNNASDTSGKPSYRITTVRWSDWGNKFTKGFVDNSAKKSGIKVKWDTYLNSDWPDKKSVVMSGGDLPDAFWGDICLTDAEVAKNQDSFIPLEKYIKKDMPNLERAFKKDPSLKAMVTSPNGHIYSLPKKSPMRPKITNQLFINKTWLDKLHLQMPDNYKDFITVLEAFKNDDPNGNGKHDEIPYGAGNDDAILNFIQPFGITSPNPAAQNMAMQNGKPVYQPVTSNYKAGIAYMADAFKKGLIDPQIFTEDASQGQAKVQAKTPIVGVAAGWTADAIFGANADQYVALPPLKGPDGKRYVNSDPEHWNYSRNEMLVTTHAKNVDKLMKWADKFYTNDASLQTYYGSFGVGTKKLSDGRIQVLTPPKGQSSDIFAWTNSFRDFGPKYSDQSFDKKVILPKSNGDYEKLQLDAKYKKYARPAFPNVTFSPEELQKTSQEYTDISTFVTQQSSKWVTKGGVDKDWNGYISKLNQMGLKDFVKTQRTAYSRYEKSVNK